MNIVVINPVSSAEYLVRRFLELRIPLIVVTTNAVKTKKERDLYPYLDYSRLKVKKIIDVTALSEAETIQCIDALNNQYHLTHGFSGAEGDLETAEKILAYLFPNTSNDPTNSRYRFDKYWMNEVLHQHHIPSIPQKIIETNMSRDKQIQMAKQFYEEHHRDIIIKPRSGSAASVDVFKPSSIEDIVNYFNLEHHGIFYQSDLLLQETVYGEEYYVDFASYADQHRLTAVGKLGKEIVHGSFEYLYADNLSLEDDTSQRIAHYALQCLKALGVKNGFSHIEIKDTPQGPRLIELNPRLSGSDGYHNIMSKHRYNEDQIDAYIDLIKGKKRQKNLSTKPIFQRLVYFKNKKGAYNFVDLKPITSLRSYISHILKVPSMSEEYDTPANMLNIVMYILLESEDLEIIQEDYKLLMKYQNTEDCLKLQK